jgi:hypothetical protein
MEMWSQLNIQLHDDNEMEGGWGIENYFELQPSNLCLLDDTLLQAIWIHSTLSPHCHHSVMMVNT